MAVKRYTIKHYRRTLPQITEAAVLIGETQIRAFDQPGAVKVAMGLLGDFNRETDYVIISNGGQTVWQMGGPHA